MFLFQLNIIIEYEPHAESLCKMWLKWNYASIVIVPSYITVNVKGSEIT